MRVQGGKSGPWGVQGGGSFLGPSHHPDPWECGRAVTWVPPAAGPLPEGHRKDVLNTLTGPGGGHGHRGLQAGVGGAGASGRGSGDTKGGGLGAGRGQGNAVGGGDGAGRAGRGAGGGDGSGGGDGDGDGDAGARCQGALPSAGQGRRCQRRRTGAGTEAEPPALLGVVAGPDRRPGADAPLRPSVVPGRGAGGAGGDPGESPCPLLGHPGPGLPGGPVGHEDIQVSLGHRCRPPASPSPSLPSPGPGCHRCHRGHRGHRGHRRGQRHPREVGGDGCSPEEPGGRCHPGPGDGPGLPRQCPGPWGHHGGLGDSDGGQGGDREVGPGAGGSAGGRVGGTLGRVLMSLLHPEDTLMSHLGTPVGSSSS